MRSSKRCECSCRGTLRQEPTTMKCLQQVMDNKNRSYLPPFLWGIILDDCYMNVKGMLIFREKSYVADGIRSSLDRYCTHLGGEPCHSCQGIDGNERSALKGELLGSWGEQRKKISSRHMKKGFFLHYPLQMTLTFVPFSGTLSICMSQPWAFTRCLTIARPRPVPPIFLDRAVSTR